MNCKNMEAFFVAEVLFALYDKNKYSESVKFSHWPASNEMKGG